MKFINGLIRFYQGAISPWLGGRCRFAPSCSEYFHTAVERQGPIKGSWTGFLRILRCQPFSSGGWDPVASDSPAKGR